LQGSTLGAVLAHPVAMAVTVPVEHERLPDRHVVGLIRLGRRRRHERQRKAERRSHPSTQSAWVSPGYGWHGHRMVTEVFFVATPDAAAITRVTWVRLGSVTHAFDSNQRFNELSFTPTTGGVNVTAPASPNLAPPGHYMLFVLNGNGVPSTGRIIRIK